MTGLAAMLFREARLRATNATFIFWDVVYPLAYLLVFGVGMSSALGGNFAGMGAGYSDFFLAGVLGMASFGIASNTAWSLFMDRDNGIFYEMLTYPLSRAAYLIGKVLFNGVIALVQAFVTVGLAAWLLDVNVRWTGLPLLAVAVIVGTAGWFFFYAIFALLIRRNDAFNTVTSIFYFVFLFASSMFYPVDPLPAAFRMAAAANPITWQVDVMRYATIGTGDPGDLLIKGTLFVLFATGCFVAALAALRRQE
jgi:ABC-type polysaccharide/polyol phosphate export permease